MADQKPTNPSRTVSMIGVLCLIAGVGVSYMILLPGLQAQRLNRAEAEAKLEGLNQDVKTLETAQRNLTSAKADLEAKGVNFSQLSMHYPKTEEVPNIYLQLEEVLQASSGLRSSGYTVGQPVDNGNGQARVPLTLNAVGDYATLKDLLVKLQDNIRPFVLSQVTFAEAKEILLNNGRDQVTLPAGSYTLNVSGYAPAEALSSAYASAK